MLRRRVSIVLAALALAGAARADGFESVVKGARRVDPPGLAALLWSQLEACDKIADDLARRQCKGVRAARRARLAEASFVIAAGAGAVHGGGYDEKKQQIQVSVEACVVCEGVAVDGQTRYFTGKGRRTVNDGALRAAPLAEIALPLASAADADAWKREVLPRLRAEFVVKIPAALEKWKSKELSGYAVEVVGFRVWDPCDGAILAARPPAAAVEPERAGCPEKKKVVAPPPPKPVAAAEPERASSNEINQAMAPIRAAAQKCFESYGVEGAAVLHFTFDRDGKITELRQEGDFVDTPTATCIERTARKVAFPKSSKSATKVSLPLTLE